MEDGREEAGGAAQVVDVRHNLTHRHRRAQRRDREVVAAQAEQGQPDERRERCRHERRRGDACGHRQMQAVDVHGHGAGVGAEAEEGYVCEGAIACETANQVPARRHHHEQGDCGQDPDLGAIHQRGLSGRNSEGCQPRRLWKNISRRLAASVSRAGITWL